VNEPKDNEPTGEDPVAAGRTSPEGKSGTYFAGPLGSLSSGHLLFASGASNVTVHADHSMEDLYRALLSVKPSHDPHHYVCVIVKLLPSGSVTLNHLTAEPGPYRSSEISLAGLTPFAVNSS
jgi:hypothetical protein